MAVNFFSGHEFQRIRFPVSSAVKPSLRDNSMELKVSRGGIQINQNRIKVFGFTNDLGIIGVSLENASNSTSLLCQWGTKIYS